MQKLWEKNGLWVEALHVGALSDEGSHLFQESSLKGACFLWAIVYEKSVMGEGLWG